MTRWGRVICLLLLLINIAACGVHTQQSVDDVSSTPSTPTVQEDVEDFMAKYITKSYEYGYPFVLDEINFDVNADGKSDCIRLLENWYPIFNESDEPSYNPGGLHFPGIEFDVNGKKYTFVWDEPSYKSCLFAIKNAESGNIVVVTRDIGGTGMGTIGINAFTFSDDICELSLPSFETAYGYTQGFLATAPYSDNYSLTVLVEDTGFSGRLSLPENDFFDYSMYDDQGVCIDTERVAAVGAICCARITDYYGQDALELYQQISGTASMEHYGYLVSVVTWEAEGYKVLEQRLESEIKVMIQQRLFKIGHGNNEEETACFTK